MGREGSVSPPSPPPAGLATPHLQPYPPRREQRVSPPVSSTHPPFPGSRESSRPHHLIGRHVQMKFGARWFRGVVTDHDVSTDHELIWHVAFDDGDECDLNLVELLPILLPPTHLSPPLPPLPVAFIAPNPFPPHGSEGVAMVGTEGATALPPRGYVWARTFEGMGNLLPSFVLGWERRWARMAGLSSWSECGRLFPQRGDRLCPGEGDRLCPG